MKKALSLVLMFALTFAAITPLTGCDSATTVNEINTILTEATNVLIVADPTASWVPQMQSAIVALKTAEASWVAGQGTIQDVENALNTVEGVTAAIPLTAVYSPLIDVLVAGIEAVLAILPASAAVTAPVPNPHAGRVVLVHHLFHSRAKEFVAAWNAVAKSNPALGGAVIK